MAGRDKVESSLSFMQAGGDAIPREYHRKVLKKIAQLTKVIYTLNTKNDENEQFVARLKATHEQDLNKVLADCTHRLQLCKEKLSTDCKQAENKVVSLTESLSAVEKERSDLIAERVSYKKTIEERMGVVKAQHLEKITFLTGELEALRKGQVKQLKELDNFREELRKRSGKQAEEMQARHEKEMDDLQKRLKAEFSTEKDYLVQEHKKTVAKQKAESEELMKNYELTLSKSHNESVATEKKQFEEREIALRHELSQKEDQISSLLADLRTARDNLALSEQKVAELLAQCEKGQSSSSETRTQLREAEGEIEGLKVALRDVKNELDISKEHYRQQSSELKATATQVSRLEALRTSHEGTIAELQSQVASLELKLKQLESEKASLESSSDDHSKYQLEQIKQLEIDLVKLRRQKDEMRLQFAREIEAAQAQLGEREAQLGHSHLLALQQLKEENKQAVLDAMREKEAALDELRAQMESDKEEELKKLKQKLEDEKNQLQSVLSDKTSELDIAREQLKRLEYELAKKEQGMGSVASSLEKLREELMSVQGELAVAQREKDTEMKERIRLQSTVEGMKEKSRELKKSHQAELEKQKRLLTLELEYMWKDRLKEECAALREELTVRYGDNNRVALAELADIKDRGLEKARKKWEAERESLFRQVRDLERRLQELQESSSVLLDEAKVSSENQITNLKLELEKEKNENSNYIEQQTNLHSQELEELREQLTAERDMACEELRNRFSKEKQNIHTANQLAVEALRDILEQQNYQQLEQARLEHSKQAADLREELLSGYGKDKELLTEKHRQDLQKEHSRMEKLMVERKEEASRHERAMGNLNSEIRSRDAELSKLRDKMNSLTVGINKMRKELEVKGQEVLMVRREANIILQQRLSELSAGHRVQMDSLAAQYKHQSQMLLSDFNKAKTIFVNKISELETQVAEWESRYRARESKPEDLELISELRILTQQQKQRIKDLIAEKRVYQLELVNREKNYNQIFNANPCVGVLNPLSGKQKKYDRFPSAPSLVTPTDQRPPSPLTSTSSTLVPLHHHPHPPPIPTHSSSGQLFSSNRDQQPSPPIPPPPPPSSKPKRLVTLKDSPLNSRYRGKEKNGIHVSGGSGAGAGPGVRAEEATGPPLKTLEQISPNETRKRTMLVQ